MGLESAYGVGSLKTGVCTSSTRPASPFDGQTIYETDTDLTKSYNGTAWVASGGKVGQVLSTTLTTPFTSSATSYTTVTGLSQAITPTAATSTVLVIAQVTGSNAFGVNGVAIRLVRDSTAIDVGTGAGSRIIASQNLRAFSVDYQSINTFCFLDSPATTSETTYAIQGYVWDGGGSFYINRSYNDTDTYYTARTASTITVMEILA